VLVVILVVKRRWVVPLMILFSAAWVAIGAARLGGHVGPRFAWYQRPDALLIGVALAFLHARMPATLSPTAARRLRTGAWVAAGAVLAVMWAGTWFARPFGLFVPFLVPEGGSLHDGLFWGEFGFSVVSLGMCVVVLTVARYPDHPIARFLSWRGFVAVGVRSYAIYLLHVPIGVLMLETVAKVSEPLFLLLYFPVLAAATEVAHRLVEKPAMRMKLKLAEPGASGARGR
jgi:peptidoglycan/LPS O-acetylase OafA/YrhL